MVLSVVAIGFVLDTTAGRYGAAGGNAEAARARACGPSDPRARVRADGGAALGVTTPRAC
jgi:hypothetical protein